MRKDDLPVLKAWLCEPHAAAWWQAREKETEFEEHCISRIEGKERIDVFMMIVPPHETRSFEELL
jgi:hypothetical protein